MTVGAIEPPRFPTMRTAKGGSTASNFLKGFLSENSVLSNRCAALLSICKTDNKREWFDSTKYSEREPLSKFSATESCVIVF